MIEKDEKACVVDESHPNLNRQIGKSYERAQDLAYIDREKRRSEVIEILCRVLKESVFSPKGVEKDEQRLREYIGRAITVLEKHRQEIGQLISRVRDEDSARSDTYQHFSARYGRTEYELGVLQSYLDT